MKNWKKAGKQLKLERIEMHKERIKKFQKILVKENLDGFILNKRSEVLHIHDVRYFSGFSGDTGMMIVLRNKAYLLVDFRFHTQAAKEAKGVKIINAEKTLMAELEDIKELKDKNIRIGYESDGLICRELDSLKESLPNAIFVKTKGHTNQFLAIKDKDEISLVKKAIEIAETALERVVGLIKPGAREFEIAAELEYQMKMLGADGLAFETIVASGWRSALPHGLASDKKIKKGDFVTIDFGASYKGYVSDITRTFIVGKATSRQKKIYNIVLKANETCIKKLKPGVSGFEADAVARKIITKAGYGKNFGHGTGHGIGLYVHVGPGLGPRSEDILKAGHIVTVEPGIYIPKWGGVRIEDDVLITSRGAKVLTSAPKKLLEL